jgi:aryl-alcohol dehydrogenase-like predicted oxidoreductase
MEFRRLGRSGLTISEISYGNWITHGSQVEQDAALAVAKRRRTKESPPSTPRMRMPTPEPKEVLGRALAGQRRKSLGRSMAQLAVAWVLQNPNVGSAIVGASRPQQVHDNAKASGVKLEAAVLAAIDEVLADSVVRDPDTDGRVAVVSLLHMAKLVVFEYLFE